MPELIKDLGLILYEPAKKRVRFAVFKCPKCLSEFTARAYKNLSCYSRHCISCARSINATKHGNGYCRIYKIYTGMLSRCAATKGGSYKYYNKKGIAVCPEWAGSFERFKVWAESSGYAEGLSIGRNDNKQGYAPENCKWIPRADQPINRGIFANNTSGFKGVSFMPKINRFKAYIGVNKKLIYLGVHKTAEAAAAAYDDYVTANGLAHPLNLPRSQ